MHYVRTLDQWASNGETLAARITGGVLTVALVVGLIVSGLGFVALCFKLGALIGEHLW